MTPAERIRLEQILAERERNEQIQRKLRTMRNLEPVEDVAPVAPRQRRAETEEALKAIEFRVRMEIENRAALRENVGELSIVAAETAMRKTIERISREHAGEQAIRDAENTRRFFAYKD